MPDQNNLSNHDYVKAYMRSLQAQFREAKSAEDITKIKEAIFRAPSAYSSSAGMMHLRPER